MNYFLRVLRFLRLTDEQDNLSLTNIACMLILVKLALLPTYNLEDLGVLLVALITYTAKKVVTKGKVVPEAAKPADNVLLTKMQDDLKDLKDKVSSVAIATGIMRKT